MFSLSTIGTKNGTNSISISRTVSLHSIRDLSKKFRKSQPASNLKKGGTTLKICLMHALFQFCKDSLFGYDIKQAKIYRLEN